MNIKAVAYHCFGLDCEVPVYVSGTHVPGYKGSFYEPPHDAYFEDLEAVAWIGPSPEAVMNPVDVTEWRELDFVPESELFEAMERNQPDPSDHYKAWRDEGVRI